MGYKFTKKAIVSTITAKDAFMAQRGQEGGSYRLRQEVKNLLNEGKAHTATVAKVFQLLLDESGDRITEQDIARVVPGFEATKASW